MNPVDVTWISDSNPNKEINPLEKAILKITKDETLIYN